jgi:hypothetical protein
LLNQLDKLTSARVSPIKTGITDFKPSIRIGGPEMQEKVRVTREKVVAATQPTAALVQKSAAQDLISEATTSAESRDRFVHD